MKNKHPKKIMEEIKLKCAYMGISPSSYKRLEGLILSFSHNARRQDQVLWEKEIRKIENPYPSSVFPKNSKSSDARFGSFGRLVWRNCIETVTSIIKEPHDQN